MSFPLLYQYTGSPPWGLTCIFLSSAIPTFIQVHQRWRKLHFGVCVGGGFRTSFSMSQLHHMPSNFGHLAGMLEIFKSKLVSNAIVS